MESSSKEMTELKTEYESLNELADLKAEYERLKQKRFNSMTRKRSLEQDLKMSKLKSAGKFYSPMERVWETEFACYNKGLFDALRREKAPTFMERRPRSQQCGETLSAYTVTLQKSTPSCCLHRPATRTTVVVEEGENEICPTNVLGRPDVDSRLAHLVPLRYQRASMYSDVARCVLGLGDDARNNIQRAIHGSQPLLQPTRIPHTGIKHSLLNQTRLPRHAALFEDRPCVVIVPIMTLEQMKAWNLEGYEAIVIAGSYDIISAAQAYQQIQMMELLPLATPDEIETARVSLAQVVGGLAYSLVHRRRQRRECSLQWAMRQQLESFRKHLQASGGKEQVLVPKPPHDGYGKVHVGKVTFQAHALPVGTALAHPGPDPLLLVMKSAINWSWRIGQQLLVSGEGPVDEIVEYVEWEEMTPGCRPPSK
jgi:hypothetical protein